jgi:site-specific DNA-adenine methylase
MVGSGVVAANVVAELRPDRVWLNDFDPAVANLHKVAIHQADEFCKAVNATSKPTKRGFLRLQRQYKRCEYPDDPIQFALGKLLIQQLGFSGRIRSMSDDQVWSHRSLVERVRRWKGLFGGNTRVTDLSFEDVN